MGNIVNTLKRCPSNDATAIPAQGCSDLSIGTSRLDKCTYIGNGISVTGETASASKRCSINGQKEFCEVVANEGMHMTTCSTLTKKCLGAIDFLSLPMVCTRPSSSDEGNKERKTSNGTVQTYVRELGSVYHSEKSGLMYSQTAGHMFHSLEDESTETPRSLMLDISKDSSCKVSAERISFRNTNLADDVESSPAKDAHRGKELRGRAKQERATKASSQMLVPKENTAISIPSDLIFLEIEKQPTSPLVQGSSGDKVLQGTPRSRMTTTPVSYVHQSPLTRSKLKAPSISTPESVQMKRSRSGRLIVPRLDPGSQNIIYDPDGRICGITNLEVQCPKGISSEPPSKRRSRHLSADHKEIAHILTRFW